jgi:DNA (cytosine-5)-methyltransferase 1
VKCKRKVVFTEKPYPMHSYRDSSSSAYKPTKKISSKEELRKDIFNNASLVCRWARTSIVSPNGKAYGGTFRHCLGHKNTTPSYFSQTDTNNPSTINSATGHARTSSLEEVTGIFCAPFIKKKYRFVDIYCGAGGASKGASNAGLKVVAGLDHDDLAILAWEKNNPNGTPLMLDAFEFLKNGRHKVVGRCHILHISNPCQPFAPSQ